MFVAISLVFASCVADSSPPLIGPDRGQAPVRATREAKVLRAEPVDAQQVASDSKAVKEAGVSNGRKPRAHAPAWLTAAVRADGRAAVSSEWTPSQFVAGFGVPVVSLPTWCLLGRASSIYREAESLKIDTWDLRTREAAATAVHREFFAHFLDLLLKGEVSRECWQRFALRRSDDEPLERIRRECIGMRKRNPAMRWTPEDQQRIRAWIQEIRLAGK
ncbi:MAG TPA: hypothetical protein VGI39_19905 [Polyangiaceae bacterium]